MENKTAVEYLAQQWYDNNLNRLTFKKALELEKQQIIDAYKAERSMSLSEWLTGECDAAEQYYSETYKTEHDGK
jgi:hypothetical protein